jgi:hypothetical protein
LSFNEHIRFRDTRLKNIPVCITSLHAVILAVFCYYRRIFVAIPAIVLLCTLVSFSQDPGHSNPAYPDIVILESDNRSITLEYRLKDIHYDTVSLDSREYTDILFFGAQTPERVNPGLPDLKFRAVTLALPSGNKPVIEVTQTDYRNERSLRIPPLGDIRKDDEGGLYRTIEGIERSAGDHKPLADIHDIGNVRGVYLGTLHIHPIQFAEDGVTVQIHNRIVIRLSFDTGSYTTIDQHTYDVLSTTVLNIERVPVTPESRLRIENLRSQPAAAENSVLAGGSWYRIEIEDEGMYRINASTLQNAGIPVNTLDPRTIKIYSNDGRMLPENIAEEREEDLVEIAIHVEGESDGTFGANDYILFYGSGTTLWEYDPESRTYMHQFNYYADKNIYFLTYGGSTGNRMQAAPSVQQSNPIRPQYFVSNIVHRNPRINLLGSGKEWMGESFQPGGVQVFTNMLHGFNPVVSTRYRIQVAARAPAQTRFRISDQGTNIGTINISGVNLGTNIGNYAARATPVLVSRSGSLPENRSTLRLEYDGGTQSEGFLEWFEIHYPRRFQANDDYLKFSAPDTTGVVEFTVNGYSSSQITAYDITDYTSVMRITNAVLEGSAIRFQRPQAGGTPSQYLAISPNGYSVVESVAPVDNSNLRGIVSGAEFIIIAHPDFLSEAERLQQHRESFLPNRLSTVVVNVNHLYNEFSGSKSDPTAIRDFLYHAYNTWQVKPMYVLLLGAGSFDYRRVLGQRNNYIPSWQTQESFNQINTYTTDDFFVQFTPGSRRPSLSIGRLNAINQDDARVMVDKIIGYETNSDFGPWRNLITYVADDGLTTRGGDDGNIHTWQSEELARRITPDTFEKNKIYMIEYPAENTALGRRMPEVNKSIIDRINRGTLILNWTGHGNPRVWAYEWIFVKENTIPQLTNRDRLTFITAATCDFSRLDDPREQSGGELLVSWDRGGAIGLLSSSRIVWSTDNAQFNNLFYTNLLSQPQSGTYRRVGDALLATKQSRHNINDTKFVLLGDPTIRLHIPSHRADVEKINGAPFNNAITLKALQKVTVDGIIRRPDGTIKDDFNGRMFVVVYDSDKDVNIPRWGNWLFSSPGNTLFRGESSVTQGTYSSTFVIPKDISHEGGAGRIALYFWDDSVDGRGFTRDIFIGGIDTTVTPDTEGPEITLYLEDRNFRSGDLVSDEPLLLVDLFDESGINISGGGIGHRIEAWLNDGAEIDLTDYYTGAVDSYQEGSIEYQFETLEAGPQHLRLRAWDVYNNSSTGEIFFDVASGEKLTVQNVYNYPNPFRQETVFTFQHNQSVPIDVQIKIYTVAGRMIAELKEYSITDRFVRIPWNGIDADGDRIGNGVYFYKVLAQTTDGEYASEVVGRLAVIR